MSGGVLAAAAAGLILLFAPMASGADGLVTSSPLADLTCPGPKTPPPAPVPASAAQIPSLNELGSLARLVVRDQPLIDPARIPEFALRDASDFRRRRIAVWGDSHIAAGPFMQTVADALRQRGVTVGTRFLPPTMGRANVRLPALHGYCIGPAWTSVLAYTAHERVQVGPGLIDRVADAAPDSYLWLDLRGADRQANVRQLQVAYRATEGAALDFSVNDGPEQHAELARGETSQTLTIRAEAPVGVVKLRVSRGHVELHGFIIDYVQPPLVTFDVFGVPSASIDGWANADPGFLEQALHGAGYDAVVLEYGTNEGADPSFDRDRYAADLTAALRNMRRVFPHASCVLVGPPDRGMLVRRGERLDLLAFARIHQQIEATQATVGAQFSCAAWNWQDLMGGPGGSYGWARNAPPLMNPDLTHLTAAGYRRAGEALARSLGF